MRGTTPPLALCLLAACSAPKPAAQVGPATTTPVQLPPQKASDPCPGTHPAKQNQWVPMSTENAPVNVDGPSRYSFWTGRVMIVADRKFARADNALYDPCSDTWTPMSPAAKKHPGLAGTVLSQWVGDRLVLWSRPSKSSKLPWIVLDYDPAADTWSDSTVPTALPPVTVVGRQLLIFEKQAKFHEYDTARIHDIETGKTVDVASSGAPAARFGAVEAVLDGSRYLVWGGTESGSHVGTGAILDLEKNAWTPMSTKNAPSARSMASHHWTGSKLVVWGSLAYMDAGGAIYDPEKDTWTPMSNDGMPEPRTYYLTALSGDRFVVMGGYSAANKTIDYGYDAGVYDLSSDSWTPFKMPVNVDQSWSALHVLDDGRIVVRHRDLQWMQVFDPVTFSWTEIDVSSVGPRGHANIAFTGMRLIVWGGLRLTQLIPNPCVNVPPNQG
ncbi:MAG: hypothetical protein JRG91_17100, partial [Deltaproteobacteria bacterium]|nr:hypothetical protein [Deltaproteobacteria bacterium]